MPSNDSSIINSLQIDKTRIRDSDGFVATIRYVGSVASAKNSNEIYAGVEWDDETRGKHDGSVICRRTNQIVRHFSVKNHSSQAGSFLRLNKIDTGVELDLKLLKSRYVEEDAPLVAPNNLLPYSARTSSGRDKPIEFLGEMNVRKRQQLKDLIEISLRGMGISKISIETRGEMAKMFGHIKEIDLAGNLFSDWNALFDVMETFPSLEWISFASNKIHDIPQSLEFKEGEWSRIKVLNINNVSIKSFSTILKLQHLCPNLEELCVAYSDLSDIRSVLGNENDSDGNNVPAIEGFQCLRLLDCSSCNLSDWATQIRTFRKMPNLETLIMDDNPIPFIQMSKEASETEFTNLTNLQIGGCSVKTWNGIENIAHFQKLQSLRFRKSPLTDSIGTGEARAGTIARLPQITSLNLSQISEKERLEAERRYVSFVSRELLKVTSNNDSNDKSSDVEDAQKELFQTYPRFNVLMVKHKETMLAAQQSLSSSGVNNNGAISTSAITVTIKSMAVESCTCEPIQKKLPSSMKVQRLKVMCSKAFGLDIEHQILHFRSEGDAFPIELDDDEHTIGYYGVSDGAEILMNEIDLEAIKRQDKAKAELLERRIEEQEEASNALQALQKVDLHAHVTAASKASDRLSN